MFCHRSLERRALRTGVKYFTPTCAGTIAVSPLLYVQVLVAVPSPDSIHLLGLSKYTNLFHCDSWTPYTVTHTATTVGRIPRDCLPLLVDFLAFPTHLRSLSNFDGTRLSGAPMLSFGSSKRATCAETTSWLAMHSSRLISRSLIHLLRAHSCREKNVPATVACAAPGCTRAMDAHLLSVMV